MALQSGNTRTNPGPGPEPSLTVKEFRKQFTEEMRAELFAATLALGRERRDKLMSEGRGKEDAEHSAHASNSTVRLALTLISRLHPEPFTW